jgi:hypothetical protein
LDNNKLDLIYRWLSERPDIILKALSEKMRKSLGITLSVKTMSKTLTKIGFTFKLLLTFPISRNSPETISLRKEYALKFLAEAPIDRRKIVWIDETGFNINLRRKHRRARCGEMASAVVANSRGTNHSICSAISEEGFIHYKLHNGAYNALRFNEYLEELFAILDAMGRSACYIIMDNAKFHHSAIIRESVERNGHAMIFLPEYSPMLSPIESLFSKWNQS